MREVFLPESLEEALALSAQEPSSLFLAGGTDLLVRLRKGLTEPRRLICLERIDELRGVRECEGEIVIGACTTHARLLADPLVGSHLPLLSKALRVLGSPQIRAMGTIGGNVCTASPAGDTLPPLYVLGAELEVRSPRAARRIPIGEFIAGPGRVLLGHDELLCTVRIRLGNPFTFVHYEKVGQRKALAIAVASFAAGIGLSREGVIERASLAWGSVAPTVTVSRRINEELAGKRLTERVLKDLRPLILEAIAPIDDVRASASYRGAVSANLPLRLLTGANTP